MASCAFSESAYSMNAKPRGRPVSRSTGTAMLEGGATEEKYSLRSASVAL
jgi:hypothetical protein